MLSEAPPSAQASIDIFPGWFDPRISQHQRSKQLAFILSLAHGLKKGEMVWKERGSLEGDVLGRVRALITQSNNMSGAAADEKRSLLPISQSPDLWISRKSCGWC